MDAENKLVLVNEVGVNGDLHEYDFYFSNTPEKFWGFGFDCDYANQDEVIPDKKTYNEVLRLKTTIPFFCMQKNRCFSMSHVVDGILCVAFENISDYDDYPEPYRVVFQFGEEFSSVEKKLADRHQFFSED